MAKSEMCHFLVPAGQPETMHKNFMHQHLRIFAAQCSCMKLYACRKAKGLRLLYFYAAFCLHIDMQHGGSV